MTALEAHTARVLAAVSDDLLAEWDAFMAVVEPTLPRREDQEPEAGQDADEPEASREN